MIYCLSRAEEESKSLQAKLKTVQCSNEVKVLQEACLKGMAMLQGNACTRHSLQAEVAAVYSALDKALSLAVQEGCDDGLFVHIFKKMPALKWFVQALYKHARVYFIEEVTLMMKAIYEAAGGALDKGNISMCGLGAPYGMAQEAQAPSLDKLSGNEASRFLGYNPAYDVHDVDVGMMY